MAPIKLERSYSLGGGTKRTVSDVERRMREPSTDRQYNCPRAGCGYRATHRFYLSHHLAVVHATANNFTCDYVGCPEEFALHKSFMEHRLRAHGDTTPPLTDEFVCSSLSSIAENPVETSSKPAANPLASMKSEPVYPCIQDGCHEVLPSKQAWFSHNKQVHGNIPRFIKANMQRFDYRVLALLRQQVTRSPAGPTAPILNYAPVPNGMVGMPAQYAANGTQVMVLHPQPLNVFNTVQAASVPVRLSAHHLGPYRLVGIGINLQFAPVPPPSMTFFPIQAAPTPMPVPTNTLHQGQGLPSYVHHTQLARTTEASRPDVAFPSLPKNFQH